jgi:hypothetical protein
MSTSRPAAGLVAVIVQFLEPAVTATELRERGRELLDPCPELKSLFLKSYEEAAAFSFRA